jgi:hypothetical protein
VAGLALGVKKLRGGARERSLSFIFVLILIEKNTPFALNATVLALEGVPNLGPVNSGIRLPEHHATSPDTSRPETEDALETFEQSPNAEWVFSCSV